MKKIKFPLLLIGSAGLLIVYAFLTDFIYSAVKEWSTPMPYPFYPYLMLLACAFSWLGFAGYALYQYFLQIQLRDSTQKTVYKILNVLLIGVLTWVFNWVLMVPSHSITEVGGLFGVTIGLSFIGLFHKKKV